MATKSVMAKDGVKYYSLEAAAKLIGVTKPALKALLGPEGIEYVLMKPGSPIWVEASSFDSYRRRLARSGS